MTFSLREVSLGEVCEIKQGRYLAPNQMEENPTDENSVPVVGGNGVLGYTDQSTFSFPVPLVTCRGSKCGLMQWAEPPTWISNNAMAVYFKENQGDNFFLHQYLLNSSFDDVITGSAQPQITVTNLSLKRILLPDVQTQKAISTFAKSIEGKIAINNALSKSLEDIVQAIFKSWFIDFDPVKAKMAGDKPKGMDDETAALFPDSMEQSALGLIPKGWKPKVLGDLVTPKKGKTITKASSIDGEVPVIAGGLQPAYFHNKANAVQPVITVSASGANAGFVRLYLRDIWASDCSYINYELTQTVYFWYLFLSENQELIYGMQQGAAQPHIYPSDLARLKLVYPDSIDLVNEFEETVTPMFLQIKVLEGQNESLIILRDSLLPRLISGQLQIPEEMLDY